MKISKSKCEAPRPQGGAAGTLWRAGREQRKFYSDCAPSCLPVGRDPAYKAGPFDRTHGPESIERACGALAGQRNVKMNNQTLTFTFSVWIGFDIWTLGFET